MTHDPTIQGAPRPIEPGRECSSGSDTSGTQGAAFKALLDKLEDQARKLRADGEGLADATELPGAVDRARATLDDALSLGDQLLEAYRAARQRGDAEDIR